MAFGFPAYHEEEEEIQQSPAMILKAAAEAFESLGWSYRTSGAGFTCSTPFHLATWGERITVDVSLDRILFVRSECRFPSIWNDWGRNRTVVNQFMDAFYDELDALSVERQRTRALDR